MEAVLQAGLCNAGKPRDRRRPIRASCHFIAPAGAGCSEPPVLLLNRPYTIFVIMPTNGRLMDTPPEAATTETRRMLERWGALHAGRSALGLVATLIFLWGQR